MVFSSVGFLFLFLPLFLLCQISLPRKNLTYVLFSLLFYFIGEGWYTAVVLVSVNVNFAFGLWIDRALRPFNRRVAFGLGVTSNIALLFIFKYVGFFSQSLLGVSKTAWIAMIPLPLGISCFTFHAISYLFDIHRRTTRAERSFINLALYILMFPQLIAGPIVRFHTIAHQLRQRVVTSRNAYYGLVLFCFGMGQKVLMADTLAGICDPLFARWQTLSSSTAWLAAVSYALQIFYDFGGYSNMAIGLGWITGFTLPQNFDYPYISRSITEFWRRWHMSLSRWFRDYLYIPLGGNRNGKLRTYANLVVVFLLCGLWHGAAWTFILWGVYHGALLVLERLWLEDALSRVPRTIQHTYAMLAVIFGWVLFRADGVGQAIGVLTKMVVPTASDEVGVFGILTGEEIAVLIAAIIFATPIMTNLLKRVVALPESPPWRHDVHTLSYSLGAVVALAIMSASVIKIFTGSYSPFIYFRF